MYCLYESINETINQSINEIHISTNANAFYILYTKVVLHV